MKAAVAFAGVLLAACPSIVQAGVPEGPLLLVCRFGEPGVAGAEQARALNVLYRPGNDESYSVEVQDESGLLGGQTLNFISSRSNANGTDWAISTDDVEPVGVLLLVHPQSPPATGRGLEMLSAAFGIFSDRNPRAGTCATIKGENALRLFDKEGAIP